MRTKVTLVLIFLNVALFFFIFKFERNWRTEAASLETRKRVLGPEAADIRALTITNTSTNSSVSLSRQRETWTITKPLNWPANQHAVSNIVNELHLLEHLATFAVADAAKNRQSLADYGLEKPKLIVEFASGDAALGGDARRTPTKLLVGDTTPDQKRLYVLSPDGERVHVVNRSLIDSLAVPLEKLRADTLLTIRVFEARSLSVQAAADSPRGGNTRVRILREAGGQRWRFAAPHTAPASKPAIELTINELYALQARTFNPTPLPASSPAATPALRITLEGNNRQETLYLGERVPAPNPAPGAPAPKTVEFYAQLEGREAVFTVVVPTTLLEGLRTAQESMREKRILDFDPSTVASVTITSPVQPNDPAITLQRLESATGQARETEPAWQVVYRPEGAQAPQTWPGDVSTIRGLLQRLSLLAAESFKSDAPTTSDLEEWGFNRPVREVTLTFSNQTPAISLRIGTDAARSVYYARVGTPTEPAASVYTVLPETVTDLPVVPTAWRSRGVGEPLPPTARIAALKLIDIAENRVLAEHSFEANGEPSAPPRDPNAVKVVTQALRALRAKEFVAGGFAESIFAAGEDRPWRFQLEATIAFPAGTGPDLTRPLVLLLTERLNGTLQFAGSKELNVVFSLDQPLVDALWALAYGNRDPGPPAKKN